MNEQTRNIIKYAGVLFVITAVVSALLAGFHMLTADVIAQNEVKTEQKALSEVLPDADVTDRLPDETAAQYDVDAVYAARKGEILIGYCIKVSENGYGGAIQSIIGIDMDGRVTGVSVISNSETAGLGANINKEDFRSQFIGKGEVNVVKAGAGDKEIDALSGATISSKAMAESVNKAVRAAESLIGNAGITSGFGGNQDVEI